MSKKKTSKKDKAKKLDLFSAMMAQSSLFRDMVARFQAAIGFSTSPTEVSPTASRPITKPAEKAARSTTVKRSKSLTKAPAKKAALASPKKKPAMKKNAASKEVIPTAKKSVGKSTKKASPRKSSPGK